MGTVVAFLIFNSYFDYNMIHSHWPAYENVNELFFYFYIYLSIASVFREQLSVSVNEYEL